MTPSIPPPPAGPLHGVLLFAHGARDPNWALPFQAVARRVQAARPGRPVRLAFLEFMAPGLPAAGAELAAAGCSTVDIVPLFLGAGGHVRKDLPALLAQLRGLHPATEFRLHTAIGERDAVIDAMAAAALDDALAPAPPADTR
jgi:sirohydrochlorin cobaltochelatase